MGCCCSKSNSQEKHDDIQQTLISSDGQRVILYNEQDNEQGYENRYNSNVFMDNVYENRTSYERNVDIASINAKKMDDEIEKQMHKENMRYNIYQNSLSLNYNEL